MLLKKQIKHCINLNIELPIKIIDESNHAIFEIVLVRQQVVGIFVFSEKHGDVRNLISRNGGHERNQLVYFGSELF